MPYVSEAQRRFFHSEGAARAGISAKTVREWDEASRDQRPQIKSAALAGLLKSALASIGFQPKPMKAPSIKAPTIGGAPKIPAPKAPGFHADFANNSSQTSARGSQEKLQAGESLTMPVGR